MNAAALLLALLVQEPAKAAPGDAVKKEEFPRWSVNGVIFTDMSFLRSKSGQQDTLPEEGVTGEFSLGATFHAAKPLRFTIRACVGCHELELQNAYADFDLNDVLSVRAGRIQIPFGGLSERTSHAQQESASRPLPYSMGHMVRGEEFNQGVLPAPIVDNGFQASLGAWIGDGARLTVEAAAVRGFKGSDPDLDFQFSREYADNNGEAAGVGRITLSGGALTVGASTMYGHYDDAGELAYFAAGAHAALHLGALNLRVEGLGRRNEYDNGGTEDTWSKYGWVVQSDLELDPQLRVFVMVDGLTVEDIFLGPVGPQSSPIGALTDDRNTITRASFGGVIPLYPGFLIKVSAEFWDFSDFADSWVFHFGVAAAF